MYPFFLAIFFRFVLNSHQIGCFGEGVGKGGQVLKIFYLKKFQWLGTPNCSGRKSEHNKKKWCWGLLWFYLFFCTKVKLKLPAIPNHWDKKNWQKENLFFCFFGFWVATKVCLFGNERSPLYLATYNLAQMLFIAPCKSVVGTRWAWRIDNVREKDSLSLSLCLSLCASFVLSELRLMVWWGCCLPPRRPPPALSFLSACNFLCAVSVLCEHF